MHAWGCGCVCVHRMRMCVCACVPVLGFICVCACVFVGSSVQLHCNCCSLSHVYPSASVNAFMHLCGCVCSSVFAPTLVLFCLTILTLLGQRFCSWCWITSPADVALCNSPYTASVFLKVFIRAVLKKIDAAMYRSIYFCDILQRIVMCIISSSPCPYPSL